MGTGAFSRFYPGFPGCSPRCPQLFVAEQSPEPVARQLLFLLLALEAPERPRPAGTGTPKPGEEKSPKLRVKPR